MRLRRIGVMGTVGSIIAMGGLVAYSTSASAQPVPFDVEIDFSEYAFPPATTDGGIIVAGPDEENTESYNLLADSSGDKLGADNGDLDDFTFTYRTSETAVAAPANRPDLRFRQSGAAGHQITGRTAYNVATGETNPGWRLWYELEVRFADHLEITELSLDFSSLNSGGIAWEFSEVTFLDADGAPFSPRPEIPAYLDYAPGETGNTEPGQWLMALTSTVEDVGTDQTVGGPSNPPADGPTIVSESDVGLAGEVIGGFIWRTTLEDTRGADNAGTTFTSSLRSMELAGEIEPPPPVADLAIQKTGVLDADARQITYTVTVENLGPDDATGIVVSDDLAPQVSYVSDTCGASDIPPWTWAPDDLVAGNSISCEITVDVNEPGEITNVAIVDANEEDPDPTNNEDTETITVDPHVDLAIDKVADPTTATVGDEITYTLAVSNLGPDDATGVTVTDELPAEVEIVSDTCDGAASDPWTWDIGNLASGNSVDCTITVAAVATGVADNTATVEGDQDDPNPDNNTAEASVTIEDVPPPEPEPEPAPPEEKEQALPKTGVDSLGLTAALGIGLAALGGLAALVARRNPRSDRT